MKILFVRHGHPDYKNDCLTPLGHAQAEAAADRLAGEPIVKAFSSTCGRAVETAGHIAARHGLPVTSFDFIREIYWGSRNGEELFQNGHPWLNADRMVAAGESVMASDWAEKGPFSNNLVYESAQTVGDGIDGWLGDLGYQREGDFYRVARKNEDTILMVSHAGASCALLARIFNLPLPFVLSAVTLDFTGITRLHFIGEEGELITPHIELLNDARHIQGIAGDAVYGR